MKVFIAFFFISFSLFSYGHEPTKELERKLNCVIKNQEKIKKHLKCHRSCKQRVGGRLNNGGVLSCKVCVEPYLEQCNF